jgi:hypothetical protein
MSRPNVCVEREEIDESQHHNRTVETSGTDSDDVILLLKPNL